MPQKNRITLTLQAFEGVRGDLDFSEFVPALDAVRRSLANTESLVSDSAPTLNWMVVDLSHSSPASITIECAEKDRDLVHAGVVVGKYMEYWNDIVVEEHIPEEIPTDKLGPFKYLTRRVREKKLQISLSISLSNGSAHHKRRIDISEKSDIVMDYALEVKHQSRGSIKGMLEAANFHGDTFDVRIYPQHGAAVVRGSIPREMTTQAAQALRHYVRAHGLLTYLARDRFASAIKIDQLEILDEDPIASIGELRGSLPDMTGGIPSEDFVRDLRDAE